jgi:hypothetical protein
MQPSSSSVRLMPDGVSAEDHIAGSQGPATVQQPPLDHRRVADQVGPFPHQGVHSAQGVLPVMVGHVIEDVIQQGPRRGEGGSGFSLELDTAESARLWHAGWRADPASATVVLGFELPDRAGRR